MTDELDDDALADAYNLALDLEHAGKLDEAAKAYQAVLALDPADHGGASVRLAAMGKGEAPDQAPAAYVATLFDQHAEVFDGILVEQLGYAVPMMVRERLEALKLGPFDRLLDLGCGTGLSGETLEDQAKHLTGVDLAAGMIEMSDEKEIYDELYVADATHFLQNHEAAKWDLIIATDVLPYIGDAVPLFQATAKRLKADGLFVFSTETIGAEVLKDRNWTVTPYQRYAHSAEYIGQELARFGLSVLEQSEITVRFEQGAPIPGHLIVAQVP
ncbi:MAG: methyltransferase domain-containing protein [Pikeienuella sp.]